MTTITLNYFAKGYRFTLKPILKFLKGLLKSLHNSIALSRQLTANREIARYLLKEYPGHTYDSMLAELDHQAVTRFQRELEEDK